MAISKLAIDWLTPDWARFNLRAAAEKEPLSHTSDEDF